jgi:hypothetical protein
VCSDYFSAGYPGLEEKDTPKKSAEAIAETNARAQAGAKAGPIAGPKAGANTEVAQQNPQLQNNKTSKFVVLNGDLADLSKCAVVDPEILAHAISSGGYTEEKMRQKMPSLSSVLDRYIKHKEKEFSEQREVEYFSKVYSIEIINFIFADFRFNFNFLFSSLKSFLFAF